MPQAHRSAVVDAIVRGTLRVCGPAIAPRHLDAETVSHNALQQCSCSEALAQASALSHLICDSEGAAGDRGISTVATAEIPRCAQDDMQKTCDKALGLRIPNFRLASPALVLLCELKTFARFKYNKLRPLALGERRNVSI